MPTLEPRDDHDLFRSLEGSAGLVVLLIVKPGCGACRAMKTALEQLPEQLSEQLGGTDLRVFIVDGEDSPGVVGEYELFHFPGLFLWRDGEYHAQLQAPPTPPALTTAIAEALARAPEPEP